MLGNFKSSKTIIFLFIVTFLRGSLMASTDYLTSNVIMPQKIRTSHYEMLNHFLKPVLTQPNDSPDLVKQASAKNSNQKKIFNTNGPVYGKMQNASRKEMSKFMQKPTNSSKKGKDDGPSYLKVLSTFVNPKNGGKVDIHVIKRPSNKRLRTSPELDIDYDYSNRDSPDVDEPPVSICGRNQISESLAQDLEKGLERNLNLRDQPKVPGSLYEKFKENLGSLAQILDIKTKNDKSLTKICASPNLVESKKSTSSPYHIDVKPYASKSKKPGGSSWQNDIITEMLETKKTGCFPSNNDVFPHNLEMQKPKSRKNLYKYILESQRPLNFQSHFDVKSFILDNAQPKSSSSKKTKSPENTPEKTAYKSFYDETRKRLVDFSTELDVDAGLTDDKLPKFIEDDMMGRRILHDNGNVLKNNGGICSGGDQLTTELKKSKDISVNAELAKRSESTEMKEKKRKKNVAVSHSANGHNMYSDRRTASTGGFINSDYNDEESDRTLPIFRKLDVPLQKQKRPLRGADKLNNNYLPWVDGQSKDGSSFNKNFPAIYSDSVDQQMGHLSAVGLLDHIAHKLNMSTLDVARKVVGIKELNLGTLGKDPELYKLLQDYIESSVISAASSYKSPITSNVPVDISKASENFNPQSLNNVLPGSQVKVQNSNSIKTQLGTDSLKKPSQPDATKTNPSVELPNFPLAAANKTNLTTTQNDRLSKILEKLTAKLSAIQFAKNNSTRSSPEGNPCKLNGSWTSKVMGLRFDIEFYDKAYAHLVLQETTNHPMRVTIEECTPPRPHDVIGLDWPIAGSALKETGGPFFLYTQKRSDNILGTFIGYCRSCGGTDNIFGTWAFSFPSTSCQDIPATFQTKNDIMRRYRLEEKRLERRKNNSLRSKKEGLYFE